MFGFSAFAEAPFASLGGALSPTGVQATGFIGNVLIWGLIPDGQIPNWVDINDSQIPTWTAIDNEQTVTWVEVIT